VVEFWATWCPPCRQSIPHLNKLHEEWKKKGVVIVSLTREALHEVKDFARAMKMQYIIGTGSSSADRYDVQGIPFAVVVNPAGRIVWTGHPMGGLARVIQKVYEETPPQLIGEKKLAKLKKELADAQRAFKRGALGRAYRLTGEIIEASPEGHEIHASAQALMDELSAIAKNVSTRPPSTSKTKITPRRFRCSRRSSPISPARTTPPRPGKPSSN